MRIEQWVFSLSLAIYAGTPVYAQSPDAVEAQLAGLNEDSINWESHTRMQLSGVPVYVKAFTSSQSASHTAQLLGQRVDMFQRVLAANGKIVLSGLQPDWHWLAEVHPTTAGSKGYISALGYDAPERHHAVRGLPYTWLPADARRSLAHTSYTGAKSSKARIQTLTQHVYVIPLPARQMMAYIGTRLQLEGWTKSQPFAVLALSSEWHRGESRLFLFPYEHAGGTSLFMQHLE
ncbi:MAG TPA: hypothetical protein VL001_02880 [Candidimonas sp.]|nr:hypothetical protein [Candidimonas sp.]